MFNKAAARTNSKYHSITLLLVCGLLSGPLHAVSFQSIPEPAQPTQGNL